MSQSTVASVDSPSGQRTILGVLVHLIGLIFGFIGAGVVYLLANDEFTKSNARNAVNWQVFWFGAIIVMLVVAFGLGSVVGEFVILAALFFFGLVFADFAFCVWATVKAVSSEAWEYPLAPDLF